MYFDIVVTFYIDYAFIIVIKLLGNNISPGNIKILQKVEVPLSS